MRSEQKRGQATLFCGCGVDQGEFRTARWAGVRPADSKPVHSEHAVSRIRIDMAGISRIRVDTAEGVFLVYNSAMPPNTDQSRMPPHTDQQSRAGLPRHRSIM